MNFNLLSFFKRKVVIRRNKPISNSKRFNSLRRNSCGTDRRVTYVEKKGQQKLIGSTYMGAWWHRLGDQ